MTSREIAELTCKAHFNVLVDVRKMLSELGEDELKFQGIYRDSMNREQVEFHLDRELTEVLLTGYSAVLRRKVIARWRELESGASPSVPQTLSAGLHNLGDTPEASILAGTANALADIANTPEELDRQRGAVIAGLSAIGRLMPRLHTLSLAAGAMELDRLVNNTEGMGPKEVRQALGME